MNGFASIASLAVCGLLGSPAWCGPPPAGGSELQLPPPSKKTIDFAHDIEPILKAHCYTCHSSEDADGGLRLDRLDATLRGGDSGPALIIGRSAESRIIHYVTGRNDEKLIMPPEDEPLESEQISLLRAWIDQGAVRPEDAPLAEGSGSDHWAFQTPQRPPLPKVQNQEWIRGAIDHFVLAKLEAKGVAPAPEADHTTLLRRLHIDLIGLPPSPEQVDAFLADSTADAYERVVDRLLASPHFGERQGRHWLDLARYADSDGYEDDKPRPDAWRYRDWVIDAMNRDMPYDRFFLEQVAGDLLPDAGYPQRVAVGFHRMTLTNDSGGGGISEEFRVKAAKDRLNTTGTAMLGLTVGCAQCHSHKYDPLTQREYYQLFAFFNSADEVAVPAPLMPDRYYQQHAQALRAFEKYQGVSKRALEAWERKVDRTQLPEAVADLLETASELRTRAQQAELANFFGLDDPEYLKLSRAVLNAEQIKNNVPRPPSVHVMSVVERFAPRKTAIHKRGDFTRPGAEVQPLTPAFLPPLSVDGRRATRLDLARWIADPENPLTPRVAVNYLWQSLFGQALVRTSDDFGINGDLPTHPKLLDWLAVELVEGGYRRKALVKQIVLSATYRQSSRYRPELVDRDPDNEWLARQNRFRVEAEIVRDVALAASGLLNRRVGGPGIQPTLPESLTGDATLRTERFMTASQGADRYRRGVYVNVQRTLAYPMLKTFDGADANVSCTRRERSNTPLQALTLLNDPVFFECAQALSRRVLAEEHADDRVRLNRALRLCIGRKGESAEIVTLENLLKQQINFYSKQSELAAQVVGSTPLPNGKTIVEVAAWTGVARTLLNLDELLARE